jgi:inorganic pyrophosphatase
MPNFFNLPPFTEDGDVHVVVETPRGSCAKFAYDPKLESFALSKSLLTGLADRVAMLTSQQAIESMASI